MRTTRRGALAAAGLLLTAGCTDALGGGSDSDPDSPVRDRQLVDISETVTIPEGDFQAYELSFESRSVLLYSVVASERVDVIVFDSDAFETYQQDVTEDGAADQLEYIGALSELDTSATARGSAVTAGEPVLVVDNTSWAEAPPAPEVEVEVTVDAFVRPEDHRPDG